MKTSQPTGLRAYFGFSRRQMNGFWILALMCQGLLAWTFYVAPVSNYTPEQQRADRLFLDSIERVWKQQQLLPDTTKKSVDKTYKKFSTSKSYQANKKYSVKKVIQPFDIATADTSQLKQVRGIGSKLSQRIVKFRDRLGGFHSLEQIKEVYGLEKEVVERLLKVILLEKPSVQQIKINQEGAEVLSQHPYISRKLAGVLVNYRKHHGVYINCEALSAIRMLGDEQRNKLCPYLDFALGK